MLKCTVSLLSSAEFAYAVRNNPHWGPISMEGLKKSLARQFDDNETMARYRVRGEAFESRLYTIIDNPDIDVSNTPSDFMDCINHIRSVGHMKQKWYKVFINSSKGGVYFRGKSDITTTETNPVIYDIKTCESFSRSKYESSIQHWVYMAGEPETSKFVYMVWELGPPEAVGFKPVYYQIEINNDVNVSKGIILQRFEGFLETIAKLGLEEEYKQYCEG
jgi:hypothetical protein